MRKDTRTTREVENSRNMQNRKPYRNAELKQLARLLAKKIDGRWVCNVPTLTHHTGKGAYDH